MASADRRASRKGYALVYTGDGKGKTTASIGLAVRAAGRGYKVLMLQFIKSPQRTYGEQLALSRIGIEMRQLGVGFTWTKTPEEHREALQKAWAMAKEEVLRGDWDVIILDEINNALGIERFPIADVLPLQEVVELIEQRPAYMHLVLTGRGAKPEIMEKADLVSEIQPIKHYYNEGVPAVLGLEF
ncbi:cob(I)yrinic acid a,c-diamide adenosyltransferase [Paenibacillus sp. MMS18-CY102]|uniref:cob(I)yrinic acid a,c-diamide adenosyltransferase n=1 Tax=Paenibacillus sp. MMS18-CY102 TaxID=2682849 RepID=UPI001365EC7F|nr:cob(I)yrinic acid a,c-diamide adenosyltransferase [Paenibacillus sp. MMS18-CY102]MWC30614.1 cob(I)yrinic acid a,c-diamide adenosyltransferase [Paenibacillus sp. MMS18-CY102]